MTRLQWSLASIAAGLLILLVAAIAIYQQAGV